MEQLNLLFSTSSTHGTATNGARVELGTVNYCGQAFDALGSVVDHSRGYIVGYVKGATLTTWDGAQIGTLRKVSTWKQWAPGAVFSTTMHAYVACVDGKRYHGRGQGEGMILRLRAAKVRT